MNSKFVQLKLKNLKYLTLMLVTFFSFLFGKGEPKWFLNNTLKGFSTEDYYIGVGSGITFIRAMEEAQSIIASQLEVSINSSINSNIRLIEEGNKSYFKDSFNQNIQSTVSLSINGIEIIKSEKQKLTHYVFSALNKKRYLNGLRVELDGLSNSMMSYQKSARQALEDNKVFTSINHYLDLQNILPIFYSKKTFYNSMSSKSYGKDEEFSYNAVLTEVGRIISEIKFEAISGDKQSALVGKPLPNPIIIECYYKKPSMPIYGMPLIIKYKSGDIVSRGFTDDNGKYEFYINAISSGGKREKVTITPNFSNLQNIFKKYLKNSSKSVFYKISETPPISFDISITDKDGNVLNKVENKILINLQKLGHYSSNNSDLLLSGMVYIADEKEIEGKNGLQFLVTSELDLTLSVKENSSKLSSFKIVGKGLSKKNYEDAVKKSYQKFKIGQRGLASILANAQKKLDKVFFDNSKLNLEKGKKLYSNNRYKEALNFLTVVTHDEKQTEKAMELIDKIHVMHSEIENEKFIKIEKEKRLEREHELSLARISAEKTLSKIRK
jgi:hypothetical protein